MSQFPYEAASGAAFGPALLVFLGLVIGAPLAGYVLSWLGVRIWEWAENRWARRQVGQVPRHRR